MLRSYFTWACGMGNTVASIFGKCSLLVLCHLGWCPFVSYLLKFMSVESVMLSNHLILSIPFSFCLQSCSASGSFPVNRLFTSGGQRIGASTSASVLPINIQDRFPLGLTVWPPCSPRDSQESSPTLQFKSINSLALSFLCSPTMTSIHNYWKSHSFD